MTKHYIYSQSGNSSPFALAIALIAIKLPAPKTTHVKYFKNIGMVGNSVTDISSLAVLIVEGV